MSAVYELADRYVEQLAALDPIWATFHGIRTHDAELTDYSPDGTAARADLYRATRRALDAAGAEDDADRVAAELLAERLDTELALIDAGEHLREVRNIMGPIQAVRQCFDVMPRATEADWETIAARLERVPAAFDGVTAALEEGMRRGLVSARRQAAECAEQAVTWAGAGATPPFFVSLVAGYGGENGLRARLAAAAVAASESCAAMGRFLADVYAPAAVDDDAVGAERYALNARAALGATVDPVETYAWGWDELHRIEAEMEAVADEIRPGAGVDAVIEFLDTDPDHAIDGVDTFRQWLQDLMDRTVAELDGTAFDIPAPIRRVEAMIAPPGTAAAMYYTGPSEDLSQPGRTWYPTLGRTRFPLWGEVTTAYHEGVPGHHLQVAQVRYLADRLSRFQRATFVSAHGEGWALYAERLMDELGYFAGPDERLGMLRAQAMRAARVVADIGMHLRLAVPSGVAFHPGETWTPELGQEFFAAVTRFAPDFVASEIVRYLGWPGQAISYKVGERAWLEARDAARRRAGDGFDLKAFHSRALALGPLGLDQLGRELARD